MTSRVIYKGNLRTEAEHLQSKSIMITDAPLDNHGRGEAFSPTDTVATALATCMLTVMGIKAEEMKIKLEGASAEIKKIMASNPRRISKIEVALKFPVSYSEKETKILENTAKTCPVLQSLHPEIEKIISFEYPS